MTEEDVQDWLGANQLLLERAKEEITRKVKFFILDWAKVWGFRYEAVENVRIKDAPRIHAKAERKGLAAPSQLLVRCHETQGEERFPVHDLLGVRVLVLSLNDVTAIRRAVNDLLAGDHSLYPLGNTNDAKAEDITETPRPGGYRALHIDGSVAVLIESKYYEVPFEIQIMTLAQHVFGQHTHDEAYVPDERNDDPRYDDVRGLQQALAETLHGADMLLARIEDVAVAVRGDIARREAGPMLSPASVANAVREQLGRVIREEDAVRWADQGLEIGLTHTGKFTELIDPSGDSAAAYAARFRSRAHRGPADQELVDGLLEEFAASTVGAEGLSEEEQARDVQAMRRLDESLPPDPLDELDPGVDLAPPSDG